MTDELIHGLMQVGAIVGVAGLGIAFLLGFGWFTQWADGDFQRQGVDPLEQVPVVYVVGIWNWMHNR